MKTKLLIPALFSAAMIFTSLPAKSDAVKREFRSTWFTTHVNIDWPRTKGNSASTIAAQKADLLNYLDGFVKMNLNGICFQVRAQTDAVYKSSYEPWSAVMTGTRGLDPGWDPLQFAVEECHKRGLECYAWINPYRWSTGTNYDTPQDKEFKAKGWILKWDNYHVLNPALPEVRAHILKVCEEIVDNYAIDGVLFDDYFYPNNIPENDQAGDWEDYKKSNSPLSIGDWRRENINLFVREFKAMVEKNHPDMRFGISPAGVAGKSASKFGVDPVPVSASDWQYGTIYSDPLAWLAEGSIDFISPQIYWTTTHATAPYEPLCKWWSYVADKFGRHFYSSQSVSFLNGNNTTSNWKEIATQVELNRKYAENTELNTFGTIYFSSKYFNGPTCSGLGDYLANGVYKVKSLVPVVPWKTRTWFEAPKNLTFDGTKLQWEAIEAPKSILRYTVYAVPTDISFQNASSEDGDGLKIEYLEKVCYDNYLTLPAEKQKGFWYAVAAYDGLGYEYAPAVINYPEGTSEASKLISPADGAQLDWSQKFEWTEVKDASYEVRFSTDSLFLTDRITVGSEVNSVVVEFDDFLPETVYYWQVSTIEPGKLSALSDERSFKTPALTPAPKVSLVSPVDGVTVENDIKFEWTAAEGIDKYILEISSSKDFTNVNYSTVVAPGLTTYTLNPSLIGRGMFFWRVITEGPRMKPTASEAESFVIENLTIGITEPGYTIKTDPTKYDVVDGVHVENLWLRTKDYKNISFLEDGLMERSMVAVDQYVYLTKRSENSLGARLTLEKYDGLTGEHVSSIVLGVGANVALYPNNTVMKDDDDNIFISNLTLNATTNPLYVHQVNLKDGSLTEIAAVKLSNLAAARVDHAAISGSVASGNFAIFFALSSNDKVIRQRFVDGKPETPEVITISSFYPSDRTHFGIAAFVTPINYDEFLANGGGLGFGRYSISKKQLVESLADCPSIGGGATTANGSHAFYLGDNLYYVYPSNDHNGANGGYRFNIAVTKDGKFSGLKSIAEVPAIGLGKINSSTASTPISSVPENKSSRLVYVYAVGNGLACYRVTDTNSSVQPNFTSELTYTINGLTVSFSKICKDAKLYTLTGATVASETETESVNAPAPGQYILYMDGQSHHIVLK